MSDDNIIDFMRARARLARAKLDREEPRVPSRELKARERDAKARNMDAWEAFRALACTRNPLPDNVCQHGVDFSKRGCRACEHGSEL